jgi:hypothetical protein
LTLPPCILDRKTTPIESFRTSGAFNLSLDYTTGHASRDDVLATLDPANEDHKRYQPIWSKRSDMSWRLSASACNIFAADDADACTDAHVARCRWTYETILEIERTGITPRPLYGANCYEATADDLAGDWLPNYGPEYGLMVYTTSENGHPHTARNFTAQMVEGAAASAASAGYWVGLFGKTRKGPGHCSVVLPGAPTSKGLVQAQAGAYNWVGKRSWWYYDDGIEVLTLAFAPMRFG